MNGIWKYEHFWPGLIGNTRTTIGEGNTPLIPAPRIGRRYGIPELYLKVETGNPTGSYKDRFAAAAVSHLLDNRAPLCLATSSGNTGAALAAYCARAGLPCYLIIVDGAPTGKINQMKLYGAKTLMVQGFGLDESITTTVFNRLRELSAEMNAPLQISAYAFSPEGMQGVESLGFEIAEALPDRKASVFSPSGGGGLTLAVGRGFLKWKQHHPNYRLPALYCVQPEGNDTIAGALLQGDRSANSIPNSTTAISGLQVPGVIDGHQTIEVCRQLNGGGALIPDQLAFRVQQELATLEGIYCEPAGAVALAGAIQAKSAGRLPEDEPVICLVTGHGFKDPASVQRMIEKQQDYFNGIEDAVMYIRQESNV